MKNSPTGRSFDLGDFPVGYRAFFFYLRSEPWLILEISILGSEPVVSGSGCSREKELFADMLHSPQAHPAQSDLVLQLRKQCFYFPALALRCCEGRQGRPLARPLSRRFVDMDRDLPIVAPCALRFLRAIGFQETAMTVLGKRGVMRNLLIETEPGKPAPGQMHLQLLDQLALASDAIQIADQQDAQQQVCPYRCRSPSASPERNRS